MKKLFFLLTLASITFMACQSNTGNADAATTTDPAAEATATGAAVEYAVNTESSVINWEGYKPGKYGHQGTMKVQSGKISIENGVPTSGSFVIDIASLECTDLAGEPDKKLKLESHLKDTDFFEVAKFPHGKFVMTSITPLQGNAAANYTVAGNLIMKDITKGIEIPANITITEAGVTVTTPEFTINRTDWGVNFGSGIIGTVKDQMIADDVKLKINLVANTQVANAN